VLAVVRQQVLAQVREVVDHRLGAGVGVLVRDRLDDVLVLPHGGATDLGGEVQVVHGLGTLAELCGFLVSEGLSRHFLPERVEVAEALPKTPSGKVRKVELRARYSA
jgi:acyl-CoA synthetase (AMP-forming)/AMP-acid ligase II